MKNLLIFIVASLVTCWGALLFMDALNQPVETDIVRGVIGFALFVVGQWVAAYFFLRHHSPPPTDSKGTSS